MAEHVRLRGVSGPKCIERACCRYLPPHLSSVLQGGCAILAGVAVATGLPTDVAAMWRDGRAALQRLLGPADARRLAPMFQQVTPAGGGDAAAASLRLRRATPV